MADTMVTVWLPIGEFARQHGVNIETARRWADAGEVNVRYTIGGHRRFAVTDRSASVGRAAQPPTYARFGHIPTAAHGHSAASARNLPEGGRATLGDRSASNPAALLLSRIQQLRSSGGNVAVCRVSEDGRRHLATIPGHFFSLQWAKENFGGGRFEANGVEFLIEGRPKC
jgi:hypothetical protein